MSRQPSSAVRLLALAAFASCFGVCTFLQGNYDTFSEWPDGRKEVWILQLHRDKKWGLAEHKPLCKDILATQAAYSANAAAWITDAIDLAEKQRWTDLKPLIQRIYQQPQNIPAYERAFRYLRKQEGKEVSVKLIDAANILATSSRSKNKVTAGQIEKAKERLLREPDKEALLVYGILAVGQNTGQAGNAKVHKIAANLLEQLDRSTVTARLQQLYRDADNDCAMSEIEWIAKLLRVSLDARSKNIVAIARKLKSVVNFEDYCNGIEEAQRLVSLASKDADMSEFTPLVTPLFANANYGGTGWKHSEMAAKTLAIIGKPALLLLKTKLSDYDEHERWSAMNILSRIGTPKELVLASARGLLKDGDWFVRCTAIEALGKLGKDAEAAVADLEAAADDKYEPNQVHVQSALIRIQGVSEKRIKAIASHLKSQDSDGAAAFAASVLGRIGPPAKIVLPELEEAQKHSDGNVRNQATAAVEHIRADQIPTMPQQPHEEP